MASVFNNWEEYEVRSWFGMKFYFEKRVSKYFIYKPLEWVKHDEQSRRRAKQMAERIRIRSIPAHA